MNRTIKRLLEDSGENHLLPFFWQHGEEETVLREYMGVIQESGCGAVCVESRPHPDFCGSGWWQDMDIILDEARHRGMKVWILDDSHFPTGYANGALEDAPAELCRQSICACRNDFDGGERRIALNVGEQVPPPFTPVGLEAMVWPTLPPQRHFEDDRVLSVTARNRDTNETLDLTGLAKDGVLSWDKPDGTWTVWVIGLSRNCGPHRSYINMMDKDSCRKLIDAVYEPHWAHYAKDFGTTIAGFFSDEPELGNGHLYGPDNRLGTDQDLPFSRELSKELEQSLGANWSARMYLLWDNDAPSSERAAVRYAFMDAVTRLVRKDFSRQLGDWCEAHGVEYIGHVVEDDNAHARPASSLGHYFRGLDGQHIAGIDIISGQIKPQVVGDTAGYAGTVSDGEFYQFMLAKMASSAAAIEPRKRGRAMCEIFGNYGWGLSCSLQKYLADHCLVRGINYFVPHAFSPKAFPDPDCPPHFYAHGHNPQYRHFGRLCRYMNRVSALLSGGRHDARVAVLYHAEAEWTGACMLGQKVAHRLTEAQIDFDFLPCDVFSDPEHYEADFSGGLTVNHNQYDALILPAAQFMPAATVKAAQTLSALGTKVYFAESRPERFCDSHESLPDAFMAFPVLSLDSIAEELAAWKTVRAFPADPWLRALHYVGENDVFMITNEGTEVWHGRIDFPVSGEAYVYDAYENRLLQADFRALTVEPLHSLIVVFDVPEERPEPLPCLTGATEALRTWKRSQCEGAAYPRFEKEAIIHLPDRLADEQPEFSGFVRYETAILASEGESLQLSVDRAAEGIEAFVNGHSLGIQIAPPFRYDLTDAVRPGENTLVIEVATSLEREGYARMTDPFMKQFTPPPSSQSGLTGTVTLYRSRRNHHGN